MTLKGEWNRNDQKALKEAFDSPQAVAIVEKAFARLNAHEAQYVPTPSERGESFSVPLLAWQQGKLLIDAGESTALEGAWSLKDAPAELSEKEFPRDLEAMQRARLAVTAKGKVTYDAGEKLDVQMQMFAREPASEAGLLWWLERQLSDDNIEPDDLVAWLSGALRYLQEQRGFTLDELAYRKFQLREMLAEQLNKAKRNATAQGFLALLGDESRLSADDRLQIAFRGGRYAWDWQYNGFVTLKRHFFPQIGNLKSEGEVFDCAQFIANEMDGVESWVRNVERKPSSFSLPTSRQRFYPDFICRMQDRRILVVEYKGAHLYDTPEQKEKRDIGTLWARRSGGRCVFVMPKQRDFAGIEQAVRASKQA